MDLRGKFGGLKAAGIKWLGFLISASLRRRRDGSAATHTGDCKSPGFIPDTRLNGLRQTPNQQTARSSGTIAGRRLITTASHCADEYRALCRGSKPTKSDDGRPKERSAGTRLPANASASCRFALGTPAAARLIRPSHSSANQINLQISLTVSVMRAFGARANPPEQAV
jgi:hypothetical protein